MTWLWTDRRSKKVQPPWEYTEAILCKDIYHCRPSELDEEDWGRVQMHIKLLKAEADVMEAKEAAKKGGGERNTAV